MSFLCDSHYINHDIFSFLIIAVIILVLCLGVHFVCRCHKVYVKHLTIGLIHFAAVGNDFAYQRA